jgi:hypothetical protein
MTHPDAAPVEPAGIRPGPEDDAAGPEPNSPRTPGGSRWWIAGVTIAGLVVVIAVALASGDPDGLERVAEDLGFIDRAADAPISVIPDYAVPGIDDPAVASILAGLIGVAIVFVAMIVLGRVLARRRA